MGTLVMLNFVMVGKNIVVRFSV